MLPFFSVRLLHLYDINNSLIAPSNIEIFNKSLTHIRWIVTLRPQFFKMKKICGLKI